MIMGAAARLGVQRFKLRNPNFKLKVRGSDWFELATDGMQL